MKRYFLIFLLLFSFNANVIAGSVTGLEIAEMASSVMEENTMQKEHRHDSDQHAEMLITSPEHGQLQNSANDICDEHHNCSVNCSSAALMMDTAAFNISHRFTFESDYCFWHAPSTYSRLLRPPTFT